MNRRQSAPSCATRKLILLPLSLSLVAFTLATPSEAGSGRWTTSGPYGPGGSVLSFAVDRVSPSTAYAGTYAAGIFKSTNGLQWSSVNNGLSKLTIFALAIDPANRSIVYALPEGGGVVKTTDGGATWKESSDGLTTLFLRAIAVDPVSSSTIYVGGYGGTVFKSTDGGSSWLAAGSGLTVQGISALVIDPASHLTVYAGTSNGVFKSLDGGASWSSTSDGLPGYVSHFAIDSTQPATLYAVSAGVVCRSTDSATTWRILANQPTISFISALAIAPSSQALYVGTSGGQIVRSFDRGESWRILPLKTLPRFTLGLAGVATVSPPGPVGAIGVGNQFVVYAGVGGQGIAKSEDAGNSWKVMQHAFQPLSVSAVATDPVTPGTVYAAAYSTQFGFGDGGVFKSTDGGRSWFSISAGLTGLRVHDLAVDPSSPSTVYAAAESGVYRTRDAGGSWVRVNEEGPPAGVWSIAIDPSAPSTLYAGGRGAVEKSWDAGRTWLPVLPTGRAVVFAIAVNPAAPSRIVVGTSQGAYESGDWGWTWTNVDEGLFGGWRVTAIAFSTRSPAVVFAGTIYWEAWPGGVPRPGDVFRRDGSRWEVAGTGTPGIGVRALAADPNAPGTIYAGLWGRGVFASVDDGASWVSLETDGLPDRLSVNDLALDGATPGTLYAAAEGGVFQITFPTQ